MFHVVLVEPEIPANTGNVSRTCAVTGTALHLVRPLGFSVEDKHLKRAGLDYWDSLNLSYYDDFEELERAHPQGRFLLFTTHGGINYADVTYRNGDFLVFGKETAGLGEAVLRRYPDRLLRIPMGREQRSLNLSNAVAVALYEALRQQGFPNLA